MISAPGQPTVVYLSPAKHKRIRCDCLDSYCPKTTESIHSTRRRLVRNRMLALSITLFSRERSVQRALEWKKTLTRRENPRCALLSLERKISLYI